MLLAARALLAGVLLVGAVGGVGRAAAQEDLVEVYGERNEENGYDFYADSTHIIETYLSVDFRRLRNLRIDVDLPYTRVLEPGTERVHLFSLEIEDPQAGHGYDIAYSFARGNPAEADHDDSHRYLFPFAHGTKHRVNQGFGGEFTHFDENEYAVDFDLEEGTPVHAARDGVVVEVKEDSRTGGRSARYDDDANYILVAHEDGSFANYVHLEPGGSIVEAGDRVEAGEHIGYSGNTGRSAGPHLHFDVRLPQKDGTMQSIPIRFRDHNNEAVTPEEGRHYYAAHPGGEPFEAEFGTDLEHADFEDHEEKISATNEISFRTEEVDSTQIAYVRNGHDRPVDLTLTVSGTGIAASADLPLRMQVPPRTERFFTLLRPEAGARRVSYNLRVTNASLLEE
ncbi:MAG: M23 family metallopeptidase [Spirochaetaceae bacterium]